MIADLLSAVQQRATDFLVDGEPTRVLEDEATEDSARLLEAALDEDAGDDLQVAVFQAVARLHWCRSLALSDDRGQVDRTIAVQFYSLLAERDVDLTPPEVRGFLDIGRGPGVLPASGTQRAAAVLQSARAGDLALIDDAIRVVELAMANDPGDGYRTTYLSNRGAGLLLRFRETGTPADLAAAVAVLEDALAACAPDDPHLAANLANFAAGLLLRGATGDLDTAIGVLHEAVATAAQDDMNRPTYADTLGEALERRAARTGSPADRAAVIDVRRAALALTGPEDPALATRLTSLGLALRAAVVGTATAVDVDEAVDVCRAAVAAAGTDDHTRSVALSALSGALISRFELVGAPDDLHEGVETARDAITAGRGHRLRGRLLGNLSGALRVRFDHAGGLADLDEAIEVCRTALEVTEPDDEYRATYLLNLATALAVRAQHADRVGDLDGAIQAARAAVEATPHGHPDRARYLSTLGNTAALRYEWMGDTADAETAVDSAQAAVALLPEGHPDRPAVLSNLQNALAVRFGVAGRAADLDGSVDAGRAALRSVAAEHPNRAMYLTNLGLGLWQRHLLRGDHGDAEAAVDAWRTASGSLTAPVWVRIRSAGRWGEAAATLDGDPASGLAGYAAAVDLLPLLAWRGVPRVDQERLLTTFTSVVTDAPACALASGATDLAVTLLEQGRVVLWSQLLELSADMSELAAAAPELANRLREVRTALNQPLSSGWAAESTSDVRIADRGQRAYL